MNCMKCGKEIHEPQVFCDACLASMNAYPVKPDAHVQIPVRPSAGGKAAAKKEPVTPEQQILHLRRQSKHLFIALLCSVLALALSVFLLFRISAPEPVPDNKGKNYSTSGISYHP